MLLSWNSFHHASRLFLPAAYIARSTIDRCQAAFNSLGFGFRHIFSVQSSQTAASDRQYDLLVNGKAVPRRDRAVPGPVRINSVDGQVLKTSSPSQMALTETFSLRRSRSPFKTSICTSAVSLFLTVFNIEQSGHCESLYDYPVFEQISMTTAELEVATTSAEALSTSTTMKRSSIYCRTKTDGACSNSGPSM